MIFFRCLKKLCKKSSNYDSCFNNCGSCYNNWVVSIATVIVATLSMIVVATSVVVIAARTRHILIQTEKMGKFKSKFNFDFIFQFFGSNSNFRNSVNWFDF